MLGYGAKPPSISPVLPRSPLFLPPEGPARFFQRDVAVGYADRLTQCAEVCAQCLADGDGAVRAARAADGDHQPALAFALIQRQKVIHQLIEMAQEFAGFFLLPITYPERGLPDPCTRESP